MSRLQPHEITAYLTEPKKKGGKSGDILEAYKIAQDPTEWLKKKEAEAAEEEDEEANAEVDQLEPHDDDDAANSEEEGSTASRSKNKKSKNAAASSSTTTSKKRKREEKSASGVVSSRAKKQPKTSGTTKKDKDDQSASAVSKRGSGGTKSAKRNGASAKSKATVVESEDEGDHHARSASGAEDNGGSSSKKAGGSPPPAKKAKKDSEGDEGKDDPESVKVRDWRHKLQKTFLSGKAPPKDEDMPDLDKLFKTVEDCENITIEQLQFSKIGKVMRHIAALTESQVPRDGEYKFRERAKGLVERWQGILSASKGPTTTSSAPLPPSPGNPSANPTSTPPANPTSTSATGKASGKGKNTPGGGGATKPNGSSPLSKEVKKVGDEEDAEGERDEEGEEGVVQGTANISLNGKDADMVDATVSPNAPAAAAEAVTEAAKDVDMDEA
ncbi:hypothetical protein MD484_g8036, partial [Candolleomyces efflorescens]